MNRLNNWLVFALLCLIAIAYGMAFGCAYDARTAIRRANITVRLDFDATDTTEVDLWGWSAQSLTFRPYTGDREAVRRRIADMLLGCNVVFDESRGHRLVISDSLGPHGAIGTDGVDWLSSHPESVVFVAELRKYLKRGDDEATAIANIAAHEIGHQAGGWHDPRPGIVMYKYGGAPNYGVPWRWEP